MTGQASCLQTHRQKSRQPRLSEAPRDSCCFPGMFATVAGISQRAPVHWSENVIGAAVCFPYVIALDDEFITVHSMLDQQQKQTLPFKEGHILQDFEGTGFRGILMTFSYQTFTMICLIFFFFLILPH